MVQEKGNPTVVLNQGWITSAMSYTANDLRTVSGTLDRLTFISTSSEGMIC